MSGPSRWSPHYADAYYNRGNALAALDRPSEALASYEQTLARRPAYPEALVNRGNTLLKLQRHDEALASVDRALALKPDYAEAHATRGNVLAALERYEDALASYQGALAIMPAHADALSGCGSALHALGRLPEALASYDRALALKPDDPETHYNRGGAARDLDRLSEALVSFDRALALKPDYAEAYYARGQALHGMNRWREAIASHERALALKPDYAEAALAACMAELPVLYADAAEIAERRAAYSAHLQTLGNDSALSAGDVVKTIGSTQPFFLTYQGENDRDLQAAYGSLVCRLMAERYPPATMPPPPAAGEPVRVGTVSGFFRQHSNWKIPIKGWLSQLDRQKFRLFGYSTGTAVDSQTTAAAALCERFVEGPMPVDRWRAAIAADAPHVLIYPEVGMDPVSARLAAQRLAPVQCNSWGHPDTSGFPTLDYYLSSDLMEPPDGGAHYTERLVRLPNLSVYLEPVERSPAAVGRPELGLRADATVFWCGQSLYKYLPQFDKVFPRIARETPGCQFAFIAYERGPEVTELFRQRLARAFSGFGLRVDDYCVFLPRLDQQQFVAANGEQCGHRAGQPRLVGMQFDPGEPPARSPDRDAAEARWMRGRHTLLILADDGRDRDHRGDVRRLCGDRGPAGAGSGVAGRFGEGAQPCSLEQAPAVPRPRLHYGPGGVFGPRRAEPRNGLIPRRRRLLPADLHLQLEIAALIACGERKAQAQRAKDAQGLGTQQFCRDPLTRHHTRPSGPQHSKQVVTASFPQSVITIARSAKRSRADSFSVALLS